MKNLVKQIKKANKPVLFINENNIDLTFLIEDLNLINLSAITNANDLKSVFDSYVYPVYSEGKNSFLLLNESIDKFVRKVESYKDSEYGFSFHAEKVLWHINRNFFVLNLNNDYKFHSLLLTPIEIILRDELIKNNIHFELQKEIGKYIVDFLVEVDGNKFIVECDGKDFHDIEKDKLRDNDILELYGLNTLRFTGSEVYNDVKKCVSNIVKYGKGKYLKVKTREEIKVEMSQIYDRMQINAINHFLGTCLVLAPAGSGKTSVLIQRIIELIRRGIQPEKILAITFTKKAQEEIQNRLNDILGDIGKKIEIKTYHGLAYKYLIKNKEILSKGTEWLIIKYIKQKNIKNKDITVEQLDETAHKCLLQEKLTLEDKNLLKLYKEALDYNNKFTFDMLVIEFLSKLKKDDNFRKLMQSKFDFLLIDECQDNNKSQQTITRIIGAPQDNIFWVGDDDQCIFTFAGSSIANVLEIKEKYPSVKEFFLEYNYRCNEKIVEAATNVIVSNNKRKLKVIKAGKKSSSDNAVQYLSFKYEKEEAKYIAEYCKKNANSNNKVAILYRKKYYVKDIIIELEERNIKYYIKDKIDVLTDERIKIIHSYLMCSNNSDNYTYWKTMLRHGMKYIRNVDIDKIYREDDKIKIIKELIDNNEQEYMRSSWNDFLNSFKLISNQLELNKEIIENKANYTGLDLVAIINYINATINVLNEDDFKEDFKEMFEYYLSLADKYKLLQKFEEKIAADRNNDDESNFNVLLFTIHSSKGKQFSEVFFVGLNEGILPSIRKEEVFLEENQEEERRVCYVGITRAENKIYMCNTISNGEPSRYIEESKEAKMTCTKCNKNIPKKQNLTCGDCGDYFCPDHLVVCHVCGKNICEEHVQSCICGKPICGNCNQRKCSDCNTLICPSEVIKCTLCNKVLCKEHSHECSKTKKYYCNDHLEKCIECGVKLAPAEVIKCTVCNKILCSEHASKCSITHKYHCKDHIVECKTCSNKVSIDSMETCEWCGESQCKSCYKVKKCKTCGLDYCNKCIDEENNQCEACKNIIKVDKIQLINSGYNDIFENKSKIEIGVANRYIIYFKKKVFGLINDKKVRIKKVKK